MSVATPHGAVDMAGVWRDGTSCIQKLVASLLVSCPTGPF